MGNIIKRIDKYLLLGMVFCCCGFEWGFFAHQHINKLAVFTLPPPMIGFYKKHIDYLAETSVAPDRRRYAVAWEAPLHYIDLDIYGDSALYIIPEYWHEAVKQFGEDTLNAHGVVPWRVYQMYRRLKEAFLLYDPSAILRVSAELGHYVSDAHVPLHTTSNYDGQFTGQTGLHAFWESRLPELFFDTYDFFVGKATYLDRVQSHIWKAVGVAHQAVDSVLHMEQQLSAKLGDKKYNFETRGKRTVKTVSRHYATLYHTMLGGMVERQFRASIKMTGDLWYTAWIDAGQPDLKKLIHYSPTEKELEKRKKEWDAWHIRSPKSGPHESEVE